MMLREQHKQRTCKAYITDALFSGGLSRSSYEVAVMAMEQRGQVIQLMICLTTIGSYGRIK